MAASDQAGRHPHQLHFGAVIPGRSRKDEKRRRIDLATDSSAADGESESAHFGNGGAIVFDDSGY
jgi:hypothetical protein